MLTENKFSKYLLYAIGEILLVVIGILIALQVNNQNENRKSKSQAEIWRKDIVEDLRSTQRNLTWRIDYYKQALIFAETTLPALQNQNELSADQSWQVVLGAFQAGQIMPFRVSGPTYREVQAAGGLYSIGSRKAVNQLANYYEVTANDVEVISGGSPPYRDMIREKIPWNLQRYIWNNDCQSNSTSDDDGGFIFTLEYCTKPNLDNEIAKTVERLRSDLNLQDKLRGRMSQLAIIIASFSRNIENIELIIRSLNILDEKPKIQIKDSNNK